MVLTICLLGPSPAVLFGFAAAVLTSAVRRLAGARLAEQPRGADALPARGRGHRGGDDRQRPRPREPRPRAQHQLRAGRVRRLARDDRRQLPARRRRHLGRRRALADAPDPRSLHPAAAGAPRRGRAGGDPRRRLHEPRPAGAVRGRRRPRHLPLPDHGAAALGGARRPARSAFDPPRQLPGRRAEHADGRALAARPHDEPRTPPPSPATPRRWRSSWAATRPNRRSSTRPACCTTSASSPGPTASFIPSS